MNTPHHGTSFSERDFEQLATSIDQIDPAQREVFLAKLVILLVASHPEPDILSSVIPRAKAHLNAPSAAEVSPDETKPR
ncbi:hypothetical protein PuT2_13680 [Pusillimonas sp. T2]|uniref:hypothetical protein n=1 Tax=Pusillimonas sp. T2 TaxID=1548123 RepID=UPI000B9D414F|nr:hypothetical protein [Pusillimonas sp. T2]OXR48238.1 hypothetical protein PuT2_13680 [Pusillimonas sp. T2]